MIISKEQLKEAIREVLYEFFDGRSTLSTEQELIDVNQASVLLNLAKATVYEKTSLKLLPHYKKGKKIMFKRSELLEWMESGKVPTVADTRQRTMHYLQSNGRRR